MNWNPEFFEGQALKIGANTLLVIQQMLASRNYVEQGYKSCAGTIALAKKVGKERLENACERALIYDFVSIKILQSILDKDLDKHPPTDQLLAQLVDAEMLHRQHQKTVASIRAAKFRYQAIIEEIQYLPERNLDKNLMLRLADTAFIKRAENVFITGATGCGKSYIASALGLQACQMGLKVGYFSMTKLLQRFNLAKADNSISKELARIEKMHLIILDDWGLQALDNPMKITLLQMIEDRHGRASTIITSQLPVAQWFDFIAEPTLADAILDRLMQHVHRIELT
eukprot:gene34521-44617_t